MGLLRTLRNQLNDRRTRRAHPELYDDPRQELQLLALAPRVEGRSVALVGNADSIFRRSDGGTIDGCDLVVRLNRGIIRDATSQGRRTDMLCLATSLDRATIESAFGQPVLVYVSPNRWGVSKDLLGASADIACFPIARWQRLAETLGARPSAGLITVHMLHTMLRAGPIHLYGFDWKQTRTFYARDLRTHHHDWPAERRMIESWAAEGWLTLPPQT